MDIIASYLIFAIAAVVVGAVIFLAIRQHRTQKRFMRRLVKAVGATRSGAVMTANYQGAKYYFYYFPGSKNSPCYFEVGIDCPSLGEFEISREGRADRFFKDVGVSAEIQTGDPEFDREFYIISERPDFASAVFALPEKRVAAQLIFRLGFNSVQLEGESLRARWSPFQPKDEVASSFITAVVPLLTTLAKDLPVIPQPLSRVESSGWKTKKVAAFATPFALLALGVVFMIMGLRWYPPLDQGTLFLDSFRFSVPLLVLFLWFAARMVKGRASSHKDVISIFFISLLTFPLAGFGSELFLNGRLDSATATAHTVGVSGKYTTRSKNGTNYHMALDSWRTAGETEDLNIARSLYERIVPGRTLTTVITKPGRFSFEWVVGYHVAQGAR